MTAPVWIKGVRAEIPEEYEPKWRKCTDLIREHMGEPFAAVVAPMLEAGADSLASDLPRELDLLEGTCYHLERRLERLTGLLEEYKEALG